MTANCTLYISLRDLPLSALQHLAPAPLQVDDDGEQWSRATLQLGDAKLVMHHTEGASELLPHLHGLAGYLVHCNGGQMDQRCYALIQEVLRTQHMVGCVIEPGLTPQVAAFLRTLRMHTSALMFARDALHDAHERVLKGPHGGDPEAQLPVFASALARKARSETRIVAMGIKCLAALPPIAADEQVRLRTPAEIATRMLCVWAAAVRGEGGDSEQIDEILAVAGVAGELSAKEHAFLSLEAPTDQQRAQFSWQYECVNVFAWALGLVPGLEPPDGVCDVPALAEIMQAASALSLLARAQPRGLAEVLDEADFVFRLDWAVVDARVRKTPEALGSIDGGVVLERHRAFNWLIAHQHAGWDDVSTDT